MNMWYVNFKFSPEEYHVPVAHEGILAKIGAKKMEIKNAIPVTMPAMPVLAPSAIPVDDSIYAVTGDVPRRAPIEMQNASTQYAIDEFSKSPVVSSMTPAKRAMEYRVPVVSVIEGGQ